MIKTLTPEEKASWRDLLTAPESGQTAFGSLLFFLSCLILPFSHHETLAILFLLGAAVFYYLLTRSVRTILLYALPALLLYGLSAFLPMVVTPVTLPCAYVAVVLGGSCGGFLLTHYHTPVKLWLPLSLPLAAFALSALISGEPVRALVALLPVAVAAVAALGLLKCLGHTDAVILIAVTLGGLLALLGVIVLAARGSLQLSFLEDIGARVHGGVVSYFDEMRVLYAEVGLAFPFSELYITNLASYLVNVLPALFLCICSVTAFLLWRSLLGLLVAFRSVPRLPLHTVSFSMSKISAALFLISLVVFLIADRSTTTPTGMVCLNLALTIAPGLALIGCASLFSRNAAPSCLNRILGLALILLALYNPATALIFAAAFGAVGILAARFLQKQDDNDSKGEE